MFLFDPDERQNLKTIVKLTLLFSACFVSVALLLVHECIVRSSRGFGVALALWCVGGSFVFVFGLFRYGRKQTAQSLEATPAAPLDPATRKRVFFIRGWKGIVFVACFLSVALLLVHEYSVGYLSSRGFGVAGGLLIGASSLVAVSGMVKQTAQSLEATPAAPLDPATRKQRVFAIQVWKLIIALLVLGLVSGLSKARDFPVWETLVLVATNLAMTASLIWVVVRLQRSLK